MKGLLIQTLEQICPNNVFLQGSLDSNESYPDSFITFWTNDTDDISHYDNDTSSYEWEYYVYYYSNDPAKVNTIPEQIRSALKAVGFIPKGKGRDIASDVSSHTGWVTEYLYREDS